jgi:Holliday junction resolvase RusA-like endonuclease
MQVDNVIIVHSSGSNTNGPPDEVSFRIHGPPIAQNGWKLAWRNRRQPVLFDSLRKQKLAVRANIQCAFNQLQHYSFPVFPPNTNIQVELIFTLHRLTIKDVDNMMKYILDAMQDALYHDDAFIMVAVVRKVQANVEDVESTMVKITRLPGGGGDDGRDVVGISNVVEI